MCEYASNDLKGMALEADERELIQGHDAYDPGAADLSHFISEQAKCMAFHSNFSRLLIDAGKPIINDDLVPIHYTNGQLVSFNKDGHDLNGRVSNFYLPFHKVLTEMIWFLQPELVCIIRSHLSDSPTVRSDYGQLQSLLPEEPLKEFSFLANTLHQFSPN